MRRDLIAAIVWAPDKGQAMGDTTTASDAAVHGQLIENGSEKIVLALPGTDYQLHLVVTGRVAVEAGKRVTGRVLARAKRVDVVGTGGRFIEPVYGRPRRVQGRIAETDASANTITVQCACPIVCELTVGQRASEFELGQLVSFDVEPGARFEPM